MEKPKETSLIKDKSVLSYISYLEEIVKKFQESNYINTYLSIKLLIDKGNKAIYSLASSKEFDFESDKFKGVEKFLSKQKDYYDQLDYFKNKMSKIDEVKVGVIVKDNGVEDYLKNNLK